MFGYITIKRHLALQVALLQVCAGVAWTQEQASNMEMSNASSSYSAVRAVPSRSPAFRVPTKLRPRVDFWIDVFTRYGKNQAVIHHRHFPQARFDVMDFSDLEAQLNDVAYEKQRAKLIDARIKQIEGILLKFANGAAPEGVFEQQIWDAMELVPGGAGKFREAVKEEWVRSQTGIKEKYADALVRSGRYLPHIERIFVEEFGLPVELTRLPFIESSFDYRAYSNVGAAGIWQFMRNTGRIYLTINSAVDERRDVFEASRAAAQYLQSAYSRLGSWPLAITSYNHGVAGVARKVTQLGTNDISEVVEHPTERVFGFASANFYPEFLAALEVYAEHAKYFPGLQLESPLRLAFYRLKSPLSISYITRQLDIDVATLRSLNYAITEPVWRGAYKLPAGYTLKVPYEYGERLARLKTPESGSAKSAPAASSIYGGVIYTVRKGDTLSGIARKYGTTVAQLRELNGISGNTVRAGQRIVVRESEGRSGQIMEQQRVTKAQEVESAPPVRSRTYTVKPGDTLWSISRSSGVSVDALKRSNKLSGTKLKPGQKLKLP